MTDLNNSIVVVITENIGDANVSYQTAVAQDISAEALQKLTDKVHANIMRQRQWGRAGVLTKNIMENVERLAQAEFQMEMLEGRSGANKAQAQELQQVRDHVVRLRVLVDSYKRELEGLRKTLNANS